MFKYIRLYCFLFCIFIYGCSDDVTNTQISNEPGEIFFTIQIPNSTHFKAYSIKANGIDRKLIGDSMVVTSTPYLNKLTLARLEGSGYYAEMYLADLDGTNRIEIPRNNYYPVYFALSPRADKVLFTTDGGNYLCVVNADGSNIIQISDRIIGTEEFPKFSPDGNYIAYLENNSDFWAGLYIIKADGTGKTLLKDTIMYGYGQTLDWSPDGNKIVFSNSIPFPLSLCIINKDGTGYFRLTDGLNPSWSPDGSKICYVKHLNNGISELLMVNPDGSGEVNLSNTPIDDDVLPSWSPDSRKILYLTYTTYPRGNLKVYDLNFITSTVIADSSTSMSFWKR